MAYKRKFRKSSKKYRGKYSRKRRDRKFQSRVRRAILKTSETKYLVGYGESRGLYHDRGDPSAGALTTNEGAVLWNPWYLITRGTSVSQRIGDEVYPRGFALRMFYNCDATRPAQFLRIVVAVIPKQVAGTVMDGTNFDLMDPSGSNDTVTGFIKKEGVKVLYDKVHTFQTVGQRAVAQTGDTRMFKKFYIKSKKGGKLSWGTDGLLQNKPMGLWVIPYDTYGSYRTDQIGYLSYSYKLYFKDV